MERNGDIRARGVGRRQVVVVALAVAWFALAAGCGGQHVRGSENPDLDEMTMSLRFDRKDLNKLYDENIEKLLESRVMNQWKEQASSGETPVVAIFPMRNETSEHIRQPLDSLMSKFQTDLVNNSPVDVISSNQEELIGEVKRQQSAAYDPERLASYGKQLGAQYYVTGKVYDVAERTEGERRVQYFLFIQVLDVETGAIKFQTEASLSKGLLG